MKTLRNLPHCGVVELPMASGREGRGTKITKMERDPCAHEPEDLTPRSDLERSICRRRGSPPHADGSRATARYNDTVSSFGTLARRTGLEKEDKSTERDSNDAQNDPDGY